MNKFDFFKEKSTNIYQIRVDNDIFTIEAENVEQDTILYDVLNYLQSEESDLRLLVEKLTSKYSHQLILKTLDSLFDYIPQLRIDQFAEEKKGNKVAVFGNGKISEKLHESLVYLGEEVSLYKFEDINTEKVNKILSQVDFTFVDASLWAPYYIKIINSEAIMIDKPWLLIDGKTSPNPTLGPLFYGKDTGCYDCLIDRYQNNLSEKNIFSSYLNYLCSNRAVSKVESDVIKNKTLQNLLVDYALLEYENFMSGWNKPETYRTILEIKANKYEIIKHKLLKVPYCTTCNPELEYNSSPWLADISLK